MRSPGSPYSNSAILKPEPKPNVTQYNGGLLPYIVLLTLCYYRRETNPIKCHEEVLSLQPKIPRKRFDIFFPLTGGCSQGLDAFIFFFKLCYIQVH